MENTYKILIFAYIAMNTFSFFLTGWDKKLARKKQWRIPEARFFTLAILGGALGIWLGMQYFHHKTKHKQFTYGIPALFIFNLMFLYLMWSILL